MLCSQTSHRPHKRTNRNATSKHFQPKDICKHVCLLQIEICAWPSADLQRRIAPAPAATHYGPQAAGRASGCMAATANCGVVDIPTASGISASVWGRASTAAPTVSWWTQRRNLRRSILYEPVETTASTTARACTQSGASACCDKQGPTGVCGSGWTRSRRLRENAQRHGTRCKTHALRLP